jgi:hypothetical protein
MSRKEIMQAIKEVTGNRHFVYHYGDGNRRMMDKKVESATYNLGRDIEVARFCYRNRYGLETV